MIPDHYPDLYLTHLRSLQRAKRTLHWYGVLILRFECFAQSRGIRHWDNVTPPLLLDYRQHLAVQHNTHGIAFSVPVRNLHLIVLRGLFAYLHEIQALVVNPAIDLTLAREPRRLPRNLPSVSYMRGLLDQPDLDTPLGQRDRTIMEVFYGTGIRLAELVNLKLRDIDQDESQLIIRQGKGRKDRAVPLGKVAGFCLKVYLVRCRPGLVGDRQDEPHVFLSRHGRRMSPRGLEERMLVYSRDLDPCIHFTPHVFRHAFATHLMQHHANVRHVQEMLGHAKIETTERYVHITIMDLKKAHRRFHPRENGRLALCR